MAPRSRTLWLRLCLGLALLLWLAHLVNWGELTRVVLGAQPSLLLGALALTIATRFLSAFKWRILLYAKRLYPPFSFLVRVVWISNFLGTFLPTAVGGDAVRMYSLASVYKRAADSVSTVLVERLTGAAALLIVAVAGTVMTIGTPLGEVLVPAVLIPSGLILAALAIIFSPLGSRLTTSFTGFVSARYGFDFLKRVDVAVRAYRQLPIPVLQALGVSALVQFSRVVSVYLVTVSLGLGITLADALIVVPPALFVGMLPVSVGGLGVREGAFVALLAALGVPISEAFAVALLARIIGVASNLPGGAFYITGGLQPQSGRG